MRTVGILLVLAASAAFQLPWIACHGDCPRGALPLWDLGAPDGHGHAGHGHGTPEEEDHAPGDHAVCFLQARRPVTRAVFQPLSSILALTPSPTSTVVTDLLQTWTAPRTDASKTGPPDRLATVRLLV